MALVNATSERSPSAADLALARSQFPVLSRIAYLNAGTFGPLARTTTDAVARELAYDLEWGRSGPPRFLHALELREQVRTALGSLVDVGAEQVALTTSTTDGCNVVVAGLGLSPGDEVVTTTAEHPGLLLPLHASGATVVPVEPTFDAIVGAVTSRTRLVAVSQVLWTDGTVLPVAAIRDATGLPVLVDGAQSVGAIPVDVSSIDYLAISGQKWLCGPDSTGALVVRDPETLRVASPCYFSKVTAEADGSFEPRPGAARFDSGWWSVGALAGLIAALETRPAWWLDHAIAAAERCRAVLAERFDVLVPAERATLVAFRPSGDATAVATRLHEHGVHVRDIPGTGLVRVSCGWWTSDDDLDRLVEALR
jgi:L-cysteine/cystine lyase